MLRSSNDRLGIPQPTLQASGVPPPTTSTAHRSSILPPSSIRNPSRLQQPKSSSSSSPIPATTVTATPTAPSTSIPGFRKISISTPKAPMPLGLTTSAPQEDATHVSPPSSVSTTTTTSSTATPASTNGSAATATTSTTPTPGKTENVTVTVRIRPFSNSELKVAGGVTQVWEVNDGSNIVYNDDYAVNTRKAAVDYAYDHALTGSDNELIYNTSVKNLVQSAMEGYNGTVFAYGQTSSGKTYTMSGTETQPGITPRAVEDVFKYIRENSEREFLLRVSYMEIYNESIRDLLSPEAIDLRIHEDKRRGVYVSPLKEEIVTTPIQVMRIIERGDYRGK
ncbi:hypothetical protein BGZ93_006681 [Podila epicladia]|nr:hypothetical protein BGZ93_006681 [Podila epicladia]